MCGWDRETDRWSPIYKGGWWEDCTVTSHTLIIRVQLPDVTVFAYFCLLKLLLIDTLLRRFRAFTHFRIFSAELGRCSSISLIYNTHTHTRLTAPCSGTTRVSRYQKGKTNLDFTEARDSEWQWHQLGTMQVCTSLQTDNHTSTPPLSFFTGRMPFLPPNQQRQSTEGRKS